MAFKPLEQSGICLNLVQNFMHLFNQLYGVNLMRSFHLASQLIAVYHKKLTVMRIFQKKLKDESLDLSSMKNIMFLGGFNFIGFKCIREDIAQDNGTLTLLSFLSSFGMNIDHIMRFPECSNISASSLNFGTKALVKALK